MSSADYVELHAHSAYSFGDGASAPHELAIHARELGYSHYSLTDHDNLAGALEFAYASVSVGLVPITGVELTVRDDLHRERHVTLLARTRTGYSNICRLITQAYRPLPGHEEHDVDPAGWIDQPPGKPIHGRTRVQGTPERPDPCVDLDTLIEHADGLVCLTGCAYRGLVTGSLDDPGEAAVAQLHRLHDAFGDHCYVELQRLDHRGDLARNRALVALADAAGVPVVATGNVHAHTPIRGRLHDVLVATRLGTTLEACEADRPGNLSLVMRVPGAMAQRFADRPDAVAATRCIAESIEFDLTRNLGYTFPTGHAATHVDDDTTLERICARALDDRYRGRSSLAAARSRLVEELAIIRRHGLAGFFLLHHDVLELAREVARDVRGGSGVRTTNPPGRGRGSSVESIVCYLTGLSHIDPIESGLGLGRFLNEDMPSVPDIDLDFPRDIRQELLRRAFARYGREHCAMVAAHATYRTRSAIRDIGSALSLPPAELRRIATTSGRGGGAIAEHVTGTGPRWDAFVALTTEIRGLPRQIGQHSGGLIISSQPLIDLVPLQPTAMPGRQICQWDKDSCADAGFLKIDVLGLGMLSCVEETVETIACATGVDVDLSRIDYHDADVYAEIQDGDTMGTFQIESRAQIASIRRVKPESLHDLTVQVALIRPGPIVGQSVNPYIAMRRRLREDPSTPIPYDHPLLEPVLEDTLGAIIFQDQVIEVAMALAGFSAGEADGLRRAMTRKRSAEALAAYEDRFVEGAARNGVDEDTARRVFAKTTGFSQYGFPKAHSAAFALLAYQSAWLRHHHPAHWYTSLLNAQPVGFYPSDTLLRDARRHGVGTLGVDVNASRAVCTVEHGVGDGARGAIRIGLAHVAGIGFDEARSVERERDDRGSFADLSDLASRVSLRADQLEQLVKAGATACFGTPMREQLWALGLIARPRRSGGARRPGVEETVQHPLDASTPDTPELQPMSDWEQLSLEYDTTGVSTGTHPVELLRPVLGPGVRSTADVELLPEGAPIEIVAASIIVQRPGTARGFTFLLLEDEYGTANVIVRPDLGTRHRAMLRTQRFLRIVGTVQHQQEVSNIIADEIVPLPPQLRRQLPKVVASKVFS